MQDPNAKHGWLLVRLVALALLLIGAIQAIGISEWSLQHDVPAHIEYCQIIARNHALPKPREGWITYHPPLFYLFAQPLCPLQPRVERFVAQVRWTNALLFGAMFALCLVGTARALKLPRFASALVIGFVITLPSVVGLFTSFNNDAMATALTALTALATLRFYQTGRHWGMLAWGAVVVVVGALALYAKYSSLFAFIALGVFVALGLATGRVNIRGYGVLGLLLLCALSFAPYLYVHNYRSTEKWFPHNVERAETMAWASLDLHGGRARFLFTPPLLTNREWSTPFAFDHDRERMWWTKRNLIASAFTTSLYDEWDYSKEGHPNGSFLLSKNTWGWLGVWAHVLFLGLILGFRLPSAWPALLLAGLILATHVAHVAFVMPFYNAANFRYYAWILMPVTVAAVAGFEQKWISSLRERLMACTVLVFGTLTHLGFVLAAL